MKYSCRPPLSILLLVVACLCAVIACDSAKAIPTASPVPRATLPAAPSVPAAAVFPFPCLPREGSALHIHPYVRIQVNGQPVAIPPNVGITGTCFEPMHTHDTTGILHIESPEVRDYTLGDFFAIWAVTNGKVMVAGDSYPVNYTAAQFLGHPIDATHVVKLLVNGRPQSAGTGLVLNALDFCSSAMTQPPCSPTAVGDPQPPWLVSQHGTGHTIVLQYGAP